MAFICMSFRITSRAVQSMEICISRFPESSLGVGPEHLYFSNLPGYSDVWFELRPTAHISWLKV